MAVSQDYNSLIAGLYIVRGEEERGEGRGERGGGGSAATGLAQRREERSNGRSRLLLSDSLALLCPGSALPCTALPCPALHCPALPCTALLCVCACSARRGKRLRVDDDLERPSAAFVLGEPSCSRTPRQQAEGLWAVKTVTRARVEERCPSAFVCSLFVSVCVRTLPCPALLHPALPCLALLHPALPCSTLPRSANVHCAEAVSKKPISVGRAVGIYIDERRFGELLQMHGTRTEGGRVKSFACACAFEGREMKEGITYLLSDDLKLLAVKFDARDDERIYSWAV